MRETELDVVLTEKWGEGLVAVEAGETLELDARLESVHEGILVTGEVHSTYSGVCGRCLIDIAAPVEVEFQELFAYPGGEANDFEVQDDHVDLETLVRDAIVLSLPFQPVCRPDCPGLDPATGERLADSPGAASQEPVDSRWAALAELAAEPAEEPGETGQNPQNS
ncbi:MAG: YceD family protein [Microbacterium sp.]|uniref:YceD family protein n=1 Tax=Microbacterium sp. TaxID=51671 RepID=UPI0026294298|nr:YceD family protein [Microbacterium sp.]MCX6502102.1 YceD family protein [Microbacterium sp.]